MAPQEIILERVPWSKTTADHFSMIGYLPPTQSAAGVQAGMESDDIFGLGVFSQGDRVGSVFYQFNDGDLGAELFIIGAGGRLSGADLALAVIPALEGIARETKCLSVAFETVRKGLVRKMARAGYEPKAVTMRKVLG